MLDGETDRRAYNRRVETIPVDAEGSPATGVPVGSGAYASTHSRKRTRIHSKTYSLRRFPFRAMPSGVTKKGLAGLNTGSPVSLSITCSIPVRQQVPPTR